MTEANNGGADLDGIEVVELITDWRFVVVGLALGVAIGALVVFMAPNPVRDRIVAAWYGDGGVSNGR